jgi:hypothetical protein
VVDGPDASQPWVTRIGNGERTERIVRRLAVKSTISVHVFNPLPEKRDHPLDVCADISCRALRIPPI